jgi:hypothetical protein
MAHREERAKLPIEQLDPVAVISRRVTRTGSFAVQAYPSVAMETLLLEKCYLPL